MASPRLPPAGSHAQQFRAGSLQSTSSPSVLSTVHELHHHAREALEQAQKQGTSQGGGFFTDSQFPQSGVSQFLRQHNISQIPGPSGRFLPQQNVIVVTPIPNTQGNETVHAGNLGPNTAGMIMEGR